MPSLTQIKNQLDLDPFSSLMLRGEINALDKIIKSDEYIHADLHGYWQNDHVLGLVTSHRVILVDNNSTNEVVLIEFPFTEELTFRCPSTDSIIIGTDKHKVKISNAIEEKVALFFDALTSKMKGENLPFNPYSDGEKEDETENPFSFVLKGIDGFSQLLSTTKMATEKEPTFSVENPKELFKQPIEELMTELNTLIGLENIKEEVKRLTDVIQVENLRKSQGLPVADRSLHSVFIGNPGTGKTTIARLLAKVLHSLGILSKGHLFETDRSGLVAGYTGQTALKTKEVCEKALGGILFIDEAYSLNSMDSYGEEAISTLLKFMEDNRDDLVVIIAGYQEPMKMLLESNPGLKSRFSKHFDFRDYSAEELLKIFLLNTSKIGLEVEQTAKDKLLGVFQQHINTKDQTFGNGRLARNIFEKVYENQAMRLVKEGIQTANLKLIMDKDVD